MRITSVLCTVLVLSAISCQVACKWPTMTQAISSVFGEPVDLGLNFKTKFSYVSHYASNIEQLISKLATSGDAGLFRVSSLLKAHDDYYMHSTGVVSYKVEDIFHNTVCFYRQSNKIRVDIVCAFVKTTGDIVSIIDETQVFASLAAELKRKIMTVIPGLVGYSIFNRKPMSQVVAARLGSDQTQAELDDLLRKAAGQKEQVIHELNANKNDPFLARLFKNGLSSYTSSTVVELVEGVETNMLGEYANFLADTMSIPAKDRNIFLDSMMASAFADRGEWSEFDFMYKINQGTAKYVSIICYLHRNQDTFDFLISDIKSGFEMAPDIIISTHTKSSFFGLFSSTTIKIERRPAELTRQSIELLFKFFKVAAFEKFAAFRRI